VPLRVYDQTIQVLKSAVQKAKLGRAEELGALKRLDDQAREAQPNARAWHADVCAWVARPVGGRG
jgi:hypothetical protein